MFFVSDLHGSEVCFRKFLNSLNAYHPHLLAYGVLDRLRTAGQSNLIVPEGNVVRAGPFEIFGCGYANMTPWHCARDLEESDLRAVLDRTSSQIGDPRRTIFDIHAPPMDTALDLAPQLDPKLKPKTIGGQVLMDHVGSPSVRGLVEDRQPVLGLDRKST